MNRNIAVIDLETDPFKHGRVPRPFLSGFYDGSRFVTVWDEERCIERTIANLEKEQPLVIYAHNGGKFDWFYFLDHLRDKTALRIINGRIVQAFIGEHEIRDSFAIMPFGLGKYKKKEIDIRKMEADVRHKYRDEIIDYLQVDCEALYELVTAYIAEFGDVLTIGSAAMKQLKGFHQFCSGSPNFDKKFREPYYCGGRVQVFRAGEIQGPIKVVDVNSMYPYVMATHSHPVGAVADVSRYVERDTCFVTCEGNSYGAFPVRTKTGIDFPHTFGRFNVTIHEFRAAEETRTFRCSKIVKTYGFKKQTNFAEYVNHFYAEKVKAKLRGDAIHELFYKYLLNSSYGKFAQNPENFSEYWITEWEPMPAPWEPAAIALGKYILWKKPIDQLRYYNICTAASITGAARATLLKGLAHVDSPIYCDTDSIIARDTGNLAISDTDLGAWKVEVIAHSAIVCGKKLYALFDETKACVKKAHKGFKIEDTETRKTFERLAQGEKVTWARDTPHFKLSGEHGFVSRSIRRTAA